MLDMSKIKKRYFDIKLPNGLFLSVEPPKVKTLRQMSAIKAEDNEEAVKNMSELLVTVLKKNRQNRKIDIELIENTFDVDDIVTIFEAYVGWVSDIKNDPN